MLPNHEGYSLAAVSHDVHLKFAKSDSISRTLCASPSHRTISVVHAVTVQPVQRIVRGCNSASRSGSDRSCQPD